MGTTRKLLLVHHFSLSRITGVTVMVSGLLRLIPAVDPPTRAAYQSFDGHREAGGLAGSLAAAHADASCVVGVNLHIDAGWDSTLQLLDWCERQGKPVYLYVHDYWPQHRQRLGFLCARYGASLLASTPFVRDALAADALDATLAAVGVSLANVELGAPMAGTSRARPKVVASAGRLVPRKRFPDVVHGFCRARFDQPTVLSLRLLPSHVNPTAKDAAQLRQVEAAARCGGAAAAAVRLERHPTPRHDYRPYSVYVCASGYEGFSMGPIEAAYSGCPPVLSDIPAHRRIAEALFGDRAADHLYPVGDHEALARLLGDEIRTGRRRADLRGRQEEIRAAIEAQWSLRATARALARLAHGVAVTGGGP